MHSFDACAARIGERTVNTLRRIGAIVVALLATGPASGQTTRPASPNAQVMQQLQQLASERTQLQADNARLKLDLDAANKKLKSLQSEKDAASRKAQGSESALARLTASSETLNQNLTQQRARMDELVAKFRETLATLKEVESDRANKSNQLATRNRELNSCVEKNLALYKISLEVLAHLEHQGFWSSVARAEPFTRLKRTEIENLVDEYKDRAKDQRVDEKSKPPGG
jgi:chromosome segregation ATPase